VLVLTIGFTTKNASPEASSVFSPQGIPMLQVGEELVYRVSYSFFHIGSIVVRILDKRVENGRVVYRAKAIIDSAPGLPFVNLHIRFTSEFDESLFSYSWVAEDSSKKETLVRKLTFDYDSMRVVLVKGKKTATDSFAVESIDTSKITARCQDGLSLFYYARAHVREKKEENVPTFIDKEQVNTFFNFTNELEDEEIDSVKYPIEIVTFDGRADFVGVFGLTGGFRGRFSNDEASVPILARMNVILGSIKVQLESWHRPDWVPPKYVEKD
jgi:Protein of unknown function (DUF3108)